MINNEITNRKYSPINFTNKIGETQLIIKIYRKNAHPNFPEGGIMTPFLENMKLGE